MIRHGCYRHRPLLYRLAVFKRNAADLSPTYKPKLRIISLQYSHRTAHGQYVVFISHAAALRHTPTNRGDDDTVTTSWLPSARPAYGLVCVRYSLAWN